MILDYRRLSFNKLNKDYYPLQAFFNYEISQEEIDEWLANDVGYDQISGEINIISVELVLTIFSSHDFKLEAVCTSDCGNRFIIGVDDHFTNADEFICLIADYGKVRLENI